MTEGPCRTFQELLCPSLPPENEGGEPRQKPKHGPQDFQNLEISSQGGLSTDGKGFGVKGGASYQVL